MTKKNPWLGLASYEEPKNDGNDYLFCGRDEETLDVVRLIDNNLFITLYGSSGIGKTSLLRAGVIPILRRKDYFPLYVRLSQEPKEISYAEAIVRKLQSSGLTEENGAVSRHPDGNDRLYLWNYFATTRLLKDDREVYPVIILDQFEEVFREGDKAKAELLLKQIYLLLNDELEMPDEAGYSSDTNYRFVASIREDFLFVLEDSIDENSLDLYKNNRYRLRPMKPEQARQVVLVPGKNCIEESEKETIADRIISLAKRPQSEDIDTLLLSIVCSGTYDKKVGGKIASTDLSVWKNNPMEVYYHDAVKGLTADQVRYIQQHFIREDGSRRRMDAEEVKAALGETTYRQLTLGANRLLALGDKGQVELLHDQLGMAVYEERKAFEERERKKKLRKRVTLVGLLVLAIAGFFFFQNHQLKQQRWKMAESQSRFVAEKAIACLDNGDPNMAALLALEVSPFDLQHPNRPMIPNVEKIFRTTDNLYFSKEITIPSPLEVWSISQDGKLLLAGYYHTAAVISVQTGAVLRYWGQKKNEFNGTVFQQEAHSLIDSTCTENSTDCLVEVVAESEDTVSIYYSYDRFEMEYGVFSFDGESIFIEFEDAFIRRFDIATGKCLQTIDGSHLSGLIGSVGDQVICANSKGNIEIWKGNSEKQEYRVETLLGQEFEGRVRGMISPHGRYAAILYDYINIYKYQLLIMDLATKKIKLIEFDNPQSFCFAPDESAIAVGSYWGVSFYDTQTAELIKEFDDLDFRSYGIGFSPDGNSMVVTSNDKVIVCDINKSLNVTNCISITNRLEKVFFGPDGEGVYILYDNKLRLWRPKNDLKYIPITVSEHEYYWSSPEAFLSPDGKQILFVPGDTSVFYLFDAETRKCLHVFGNQDGIVVDAAFSPDGKFIVSSTQYSEKEDDIMLYNSKTFDTIVHIASDITDITYAISPDNKHIAVSTNDHPSIWDMETGKSDQEIPYEGIPEEILYHPNGSVLIVDYYWDEEDTAHYCFVDVYEPSTMLYNRLINSKDPIDIVDVTPNGKQIVTVSDTLLSIWDFETGHLIKSFKHGFYYTSKTPIVISPDSKQVCFKDAVIDLNTLKLTYCNSAPGAFSRDGHYYMDLEGNVYDRKEGVRISENQIGSMDYDIGEFSLSPDGKKLIGVRNDGDKSAIVIQDFPPLQDLIDQARERFKDRPLTEEERRMYYLE